MTDDERKLLSNFERQLQHLIYIHKEAESEIARLRQQLDTNEQERIKLQAQCDHLTLQLNNMKSATAISLEGSDIRETKSRLSQLVREVDKCIALLNE